VDSAQQRPERGRAMAGGVGGRALVGVGGGGEGPRQIGYTDRKR
jgi:hypothetical protein